jgi:hypothetical protein
MMGFMVAFADGMLEGMQAGDLLQRQHERQYERRHANLVPALALQHPVAKVPQAMGGRAG